MSEDIVKNNPMREFAFALGGVALFLGIVLLIGVSAFLRPAGEHITAETTETSAAADEAAAKEAAPAATAPAAAAPAETGTAAATPEATDASVMPAEDTSGTVVAAESGTATASGTVSQTAVAEADLTAEQADGDLDSGAAATPAAAQ